MNKTDYPRLDYEYRLHHIRYKARALKDHLLCQDCGGNGQYVAENICGYDRYETCGWCQGVGYLTRWLRGQWLKYQRLKWLPSIVRCEGMTKRWRELWIRISFAISEGIALGCVWNTPEAVVVISINLLPKNHESRRELNFVVIVNGNRKTVCLSTNNSWQLKIYYGKITAWIKNLSEKRRGIFHA